MSEAEVKLKPDDLDAMDGHAIGLRNVGGRLEGRDPHQAVLYYQEALEIERKITERSNNLEYLHTLALIYRDLGSVYDDLGEYPRSLENSRKCVKIIEVINHSDPQNANIRRSLAIEYTNEAGEFANVGNTREALKQLNRGVDTMRNLVESSPENTGYRHYLAEILAAGGAILLKAHKPEDALKEFGEAQSIFRSGSEITRAAACAEKMGEIVALTHNPGAAADYYHQTLAVAEPLISTNPPSLDSLYMAADAYSGLGDLSLKEAAKQTAPVSRQKALSEARSWYTKSLAAWHQIEHPSHSAPSGFDAGDPALVAKKLKQCDAALAGSRAR